MSHFFIARQPIFDQSLKLFAYELLFRDAASSAAPCDMDDDVATAQVLNTSEEIGLERLVGRHHAFINLPKKFLVEPDLLPLQPGNFVLEVLEHVAFDQPVVDGMQVLADRGYTLALDDFVYDPSFDQALSQVEIVKIDVPRIAPENWETEITRLKDLGLKVLAEKVETSEEFETLKALGCDYFQGYFFARPKLISGKRLAPNKLAMIELMSAINNPETDIDELSELVSRDVAISLRALNYVNSAACALKRRVESVREAVVYLGREDLRRWVTLLIMAKLEDKPDQLITLSLIRAKFLELLAQEGGAEDNSSAFFTVGLFSALDALMDSSMADLVSALGISGELGDALANGRGNKAAALQLAVSMERGELAGFSPFNISAAEAAQLHQRATEWADDTLTSMGLV